MRNFIRRRRSIAAPEITLTPLVDTALNLLIIFMIATPVVHNAIRVDLPRGSAKEDQGAPQELIVTIKNDGKQEKFYLNDIPMNKERVLAEIKKVALKQNDTWIYIRGDRTISYGVVTEFVEEMKQVEGVAHVALATQKA